jgi:hypothetical protein
MLSKELNNEINELSNKNLGQLLNTIENLNASEVVVAIVKTFFWKQSDEVKSVLDRELSKQVRS